MRYLALFLGSLAALGQTPAQTLKERALGDAVAKEIERQDGRINDPAILEYLQRIENRLALAAQVKPLELRLTRNSKLIAFPLPNGVLYISSGLLERMKSEAELAGLLAHEMGHGPWELLPPAQATIPLFVPPCVLSSAGMLKPMRWTNERREREQQATATAVKTLQAAGYDPEGILDLLSKLSYEHPDWAKSIVSDDLLDLRAGLETDVPPAGGYVLDASEFLQMQSRLPR